MKASEFFELPESLACFAEHFSPDVPPWEWLKRIEAALKAWHFGAPLPPLPPGVHVEGLVYLHPTVRLPSHATLIGPVWIGPETQIRPGAFVRQNVIAGARCVLGNACEYKNSLLMDGVETAHFNYVGDSILGNRAHLGAGAICANVRLDRGPVVVQAEGASHPTGLRKFGAILGDQAEVGCNAVLNPGTLLGRRSLVAPAIAFGGYLPPNTIARSSATVSLVARR